MPDTAAQTKPTGSSGDSSHTLLFSRSFVTRLCLETSAIAPACGREGTVGSVAPGERWDLYGWGLHSAWHLLEFPGVPQYWLYILVLWLRMGEAG